MTTVRAELMRLLTELGDEASDLRIGQLIANLATLAQGARSDLGRRG
jgi:hypothetical protein